MDVVYLFFEGGNVRIPFYDYDRPLFQALAGSRLGRWDYAGRCYTIPCEKYGCEYMRKVLPGRPFAEVLKEERNPVMVNGFFTHEPETEQWFPLSCREKLETELRSRKYSPNTRTAYLRYNQALCQWLQKAPESVTAGDIKRYLSFMEETGSAAASSMNLALSAFKFFYRQVLGQDTAREQRRPHQDRRLPVALSKTEVMSLFEAQKNLKHRLLLMMVYASGLRVSEAVSLKRQDVDLARKTVRISGGKGRKDRYTILADAAAASLRRYYAGNDIGDWLFPGAAPDTHLSVRSAQHVCENALKKADIQKDASIHSLRHTFATHLLENGTDIRYIQELLGHKTIKTTLRYTHVARRTVLKIASPLDTLDEPE